MEVAVNTIGPRIQGRRESLGLSRSELALKLSVSTQTVVNIERDSTYNIGSCLLSKLEGALGVEFEIVMKENDTMASEIHMGNDEFILHVRKNNPICGLSNEQLGKRIWQWIRNADPSASKLHSGKAQPCLWAAETDSSTDSKLPQRARQFSFRRDLLPDLFSFLERLS